MDSRGEVVLDTDFGVGTNVVHLDKRIKNPTLLKSAVSQKLIQETISEELRVLYVAMTRAREKLYMIGTVKDAQKAVEGWQAVSDELLAGGWYSYSYEAGLKIILIWSCRQYCCRRICVKGRFRLWNLRKKNCR